MAVIGFNLLKPNLAFYSITGLGVGIGLGILLSNFFPIGWKIGSLILVISCSLSVYIWHKEDVKKAFLKEN